MSKDKKSKKAKATNAANVVAQQADAVATVAAVVEPLPALFGLIPNEIIPGANTMFGKEPDTYVFDGFKVQGDAVAVTDRFVRSFFQSNTRESAWYADEGKASIHQLFRHLNDFGEWVANSIDPRHRSTHNFLKFLRGAFEKHRVIIEHMMSEGRISFDYLWFVYKKDFEVQFKVGEDMCGGVIQNAQYKNSFFGGPYFEISVKTITTDGRAFVTKLNKISIGKFTEAALMSDLSVAPLTTDVRERLTERGRLYSRIAIGAHFMNYGGSLVRKGSWVRASVEYKGDGRVMIDLANFKRTDPDYFNSDYSYDDDDSGKPEKMKELPEEMMYMASPIVHGFSFSCKKWGELRVANIAEIQWDEEAYDRLVLDQNYKDLVYALVKNTSKDSAFTDIISGKGGGCIFLLHGKPGTGKTLTAEAVAELLKRPLYSVSIGELGTNPDALEQRLRVILEIAETWNAVLLLDEADIFLEARNDHDIVRNAMVGIFLRLLEYHQGVMFLTTNRAKNIDSAMQSRIAVAIAYEDHDVSNREQIWTNLLAAAGITSLSAADVSALAKYDINGRQIKTNIRLAQCLAHDKGIPVDLRMVKNAIAIAEKFKSDMAKK